MRIDITIPGAESSEHEEFGWPPIDDPVGAPGTTTFDFYDAGTKEVRVTDFTFNDSAITVSGNWEDILIEGAQIIVEYTVMENEALVTKDWSTTVHFYSGITPTPSLSSWKFYPKTFPEDYIDIVAFRYWQDCPNWGAVPEEVFTTASDGIYKFLSYWGHPTTFTTNVCVDKDSRVPATTIVTEFTPDDEKLWLKRKPIIGPLNFESDDYKRWPIGGGFSNIDIRLKKSQDQKYSSDPSGKLQCDPQLLADGNTKWKIKDNDQQLEYTRRGVMGRFDLEIKEIGSGSVAHYFFPYQSGDDGSDEFGTKYYPEIIERTIKDDDGSDIKEPVGIFFSPFDTSDRDNFKLTLEPTYGSEEYDQKPIQAGKKYKIFLFPRRWGYYTRTRETTCGDMINQVNQSLSMRVYPAATNNGGWCAGWSASVQSLVDFHLASRTYGFDPQGPIEWEKPYGESTIIHGPGSGSCGSGDCFSSLCAIHSAGCHCFMHCSTYLLGSDCSTSETATADDLGLVYCVDTGISDGIHCGGMCDGGYCPENIYYGAGAQAETNCAIGYGVTYVTTLNARVINNSYKVGFWRDRFPNQMLRMQYAVEPIADTPSGISMNQYGINVHANNQTTSLAGNLVRIAEIWAQSHATFPTKFSATQLLETITFPGVSDASYDFLLGNYPLIITGMNALHMISFYSDEEAYKNRIGGSFLGGYQRNPCTLPEGMDPNGQYPGQISAEFRIRKAQDHSEDNFDYPYYPVDPPEHKTPFIFGNQRTTNPSTYLRDRKMPISLNAFHNTIGTKWDDYYSKIDNSFMEQIFRKVAGVPSVNVSLMDILDSATEDLRWIPSERSSNFWTNYGLPAYDTNQDYSKWNNIPVGMGICPDRAGALVGIIIQGNKPVYVWRRLTEEFSLGTLALENETEFNTYDAYTGHTQSFESTFASGYSHCNNVETPTEVYTFWNGEHTYCIERTGSALFETGATSVVGWADELEYEFVDQFSGTGTRKLTAIGRDVQLEQCWNPKMNPRCLDENNPMLPNAFYEASGSVDVVRDYRVIANGNGQYDLDVPVFVMFSREKQITIPTEGGQFADDWPYPKCRVARNSFSSWGNGYWDPETGGGDKCNAPAFEF